MNLLDYPLILRTRRNHGLEHATLNLLAREPSKIPVKPKRLKAAINPQFQAALLAR